MQASFQLERRVQFADTDMAGIAHFSNYFRYMEETEHAFLRSRGLSVAIADPKGTLGFPKLSASCDFKRPLQYDDVVRVGLLARSDGKTISYDFTFQDEQTSIASGKLRVAFCRFPAGRPPYAIPIPDPIRKQLFS